MSVKNINNNFDTILYLHVLEHIEDDILEINNASQKLNLGGHLVIMAPAHQKIYGNLDKAVGHFRRYEKDFFKKKFVNLKLINLKYLDSMGYILYFLNKIFFQKRHFHLILRFFYGTRYLHQSQ